MKVIFHGKVCNVELPFAPKNGQLNIIILLHKISVVILFLQHKIIVSYLLFQFVLSIILFFFSGRFWVPLYNIFVNGTTDPKIRNWFWILEGSPPKPFNNATVSFVTGFFYFLSMLYLNSQLFSICFWLVFIRKWSTFY